ncbi:MAG: hypothetical protein KIS87_08140 [Phycisphaeraceae bacterium]|nr:hypothetical protein [Phycisphaeraceae bacterium]
MSTMSPPDERLDSILAIARRREGESAPREPDAAHRVLSIARQMRRQAEPVESPRPAAPKTAEDVVRSLGVPTAGGDRIELAGHSLTPTEVRRVAAALRVRNRGPIEQVARTLRERASVGDLETAIGGAREAPGFPKLPTSPVGQAMDELTGPQRVAARIGAVAEPAARDAARRADWLIGTLRLGAASGLAAKVPADPLRERAAAEATRFGLEREGVEAGPFERFFHGGPPAPGEPEATAAIAEQASIPEQVAGSILGMGAVAVDPVAIAVMPVAGPVGSRVVSSPPVRALVGSVVRRFGPRAGTLVETQLSHAGGVGVFSGLHTAALGGSPEEIAESVGHGSLFGLLVFGTPIGAFRALSGRYTPMVRRAQTVQDVQEVMTAARADVDAAMRSATDKELADLAAHVRSAEHVPHEIRRDFNRAIRAEMERRRAEQAQREGVKPTHQPGEVVASVDPFEPGARRGPATTGRELPSGEGAIARRAVERRASEREIEEALKRADAIRKAAREQATAEEMAERREAFWKDLGALEAWQVGREFGRRGEVFPPELWPEDVAKSASLSRGYADGLEDFYGGGEPGPPAVAPDGPREPQGPPAGPQAIVEASGTARPVERGVVDPFEPGARRAVEEMPTSERLPEPGRPEGAARQIGELVARARTPTNQVDRVAYAPAENTSVSEVLGIDLAGWTHTIDNFAVRHTLGKHGDPITEDRRGQVAVTEDDFAMLPEIVGTPDEVVALKEHRAGLPKVRYTKRVNGVTYVVEEARAGKRQLALVTMWKRKGGPRGRTGAPPEGGPQFLRPERPPGGQEILSPAPGSFKPVGRMTRPELLSEARDRGVLDGPKTAAALRRRVEAARLSAEGGPPHETPIAPGRDVSARDRRGQAVEPAPAEGGGGETSGDLAARARVRRPRAFTKTDIQRRLIELAERELPTELVADPTAGLEETPGVVTEGIFSTAFSGPIPLELRYALEGRRHLLRLIKANVGSRGTGDDALLELGTDRYIEILEEAAASRLTRAKRAMESLGGAALPELRLLNWLDDHQWDVQAERPDWDVVPVGSLSEGAAFEMLGVPFEVIRDGDYLLLTSGDAPSDLTTHLEALRDLPIDRGTLQPGPGAVPVESMSRAELLAEAERLGVSAGSKTKKALSERVTAARTAAPRQETERAGQVGGDLPAEEPPFGPPDRALPQDAGTPGSDRVPVDPIVGGDPRSPREIILDLTRQLRTRVRKGKPARRGALGSYYPGSTRTVIRYAGDLDTTAHEIAHALDDAYGLVAEWAGDATSPFDAELVPHFSRHGSEPPKSSENPRAYRRAEGVAEWVRAWAVNPEAAARAAPRFAEHFERTVPAVVRKSLRAFGDEVRRFAGASPVARIKANVEFEDPIATGPVVARVRDAFSRREGEPFQTTGKDVAWSHFADTLAPLWKGIDLARRLRGIEDLLPSQDPKILVRNHAGFTRKAMDVLKHGPIDAKGQRVEGVGGMEWLLEPFDRSSSKTLNRDMQDAVALMIGERVGERAAQIDAQTEALIAAVQERVDKGTLDPDKATRMMERIRASAQRRKDRLAGIGGGVMSDEAVAAKAVEELRSDPVRFARLEEGARRYRLWADSVLQYARDKGRLSAEQYAAIRAANQQYVSMQRLFESVAMEMAPGPGKRLGTARQVVHRFVGSTRPIINPYVSLMRQTYEIMREADRNEALRSVRDLLTQERGMYAENRLDLDQIGSRARQGDEDTIKIYVDGKAEHWQFERGIYKALKNWGEVPDSSIVIKFLTLLPRMMHTAIVHSPDFMIRNVIRDTHARAVLSRTGNRPWSALYFTTPEGISTFNRDLSLFYRYGGGFFGHHLGDRTTYYRQMRLAVRTAAGDGSSIIAFPADAVRAYHRFASMSETIGRLSEFRSAWKKAREELGYDDYDAGLYAAFQARDITDYAVAGRATAWFNRFVPFTNAGVQGTLRMIRGATEGGPSVAAAFGTRWMFYVLSFEAAAYLWNLWTGDEEEERQQPAYMRDFFWNYKVGPDLWLRYPKPWELGVLASGVRRAIDDARGVPNAWEGYGRSAVVSLLPADETAILGPFRSIGEMMANYDTFRERSIVSRWEEDLDLDLRKGTARASRVGQILQEALTGVHPRLGIDARKVDHFIQGQLGGLGRAALRLSDVGREDKPDIGRVFTGMTGITASSPAFNAADLQWVMNHAHRRAETSKPYYRRLQRLLDHYAAAKSAEDRDRRAAAVREYATRIRRSLEQR